MATVTTDPPHDVFFFEAFEEEEKLLRSLLPSTLHAGFTWKTVQEYGVPDPPAQLISTRTQSILPSHWYRSLHGLLARSTGYDHITRLRRMAASVEDAASLAAGYLPQYCQRAVAEQAMLLWTGLLRRLPRQMANFRSFHRDGLTGQELIGKEVLVVGVGNIGGEVVRLARSLGMHVRGVDLVYKHPDLTYTSIDEGLPRADVIVCTMNLTNHNVGYFSYGLLRRAKPGAIFVNVARGELSPARDLLRCLEEGILGGVGLDVFENEHELAGILRSGAKVDSPVLDLAGRLDVIVTPHNAFNVKEAVKRKAEQSVDSVLHFLTHKTFPHPVPSMDVELQQQQQ